MKKKNLLLSCMLLFLTGWNSSSAQYTVDRTKYPEYSPIMRPDYSLLPSRAVKSKGLQTKSDLPDHVNIALTRYFPPIFNQDGGSCGAAAGIGYKMTEELASLRDLDASLPEHRLPTHFTWLLSNMNSSEQEMARSNGVPSVKTYGGITYSDVFGSQDVKDNDCGWMQGYSKWYEAMWNRIVSDGNFPLTVATEEGREAVKRWLWNHNGDSAFHAGGVCTIGVASGMTQARIAGTATNSALGVAGKLYVAQWGTSYDHALTIVGYDDRIEFDLDGNGTYGETSKDEKGAWIIANSWGNGWANSGFIYCPYKYAGPITTASTGYWSPGVYHVRKGYRPMRTFKILMDYSKRSEILLGAGIAEDTSATQPEQVIRMEHFRYAGDGDGDGVDADMPMLGRWADGIHYEPMEFGYDLTDMTANYDRTRPLKYFFYIESKKTATGKGHIYRCSLLDYELDPEGIEQPFHIDTVEVLNGGKTTMIAVTVMGEAVYAPRNLCLSGNVLTWQAPQESYLTLKKYNIYTNGVLTDSVKADQRSFTLPDGAEEGYTVSAVYGQDACTVESAKSNAVRSFTYQASTSNATLRTNNAGFTIPDIFTTPLGEATIEFWLKPTLCVNWNQQIGPGWGSFLFHVTDSRQIVVGWNTTTGDQYKTVSVLTIGAWNHVAITIKGNVLTVYVNGLKRGTVTSANYSGMPALGSLTFGSHDSKLSGQIDEVRIWKVARTQAQVLASMRMEIANPPGQSGLLAYLRMDRIEDQGQTKLRECAGGHHAILDDATTETSVVDNSFLIASASLQAKFTIPSGIHYQGEKVKLTPVSSVSTTDWTWDAPGAGATGLKVESPELIFPQPGNYPVTLTVKDCKGAIDDTTMTLTIAALEKPKADFDIASVSMPAGDHFSFVNHTQGLGCSYTWSMPGAEVETLKSTHAGAVYAATGKHEVTLTATNAAGTSTVTKQIEVTLTSPAIDFTVHPSAILKGDRVYLNDNSRYQPERWMWDVVSGAHHTGITGAAHSSFTPTHPGYYDVTLTAGNGIGENALTQKRIFVVSNADAGKGLHFAGNGERVQMASPIKESTTAFTLDWWMYPNKLLGSASMASGDSVFNVATDDNGAITVSLSGKSVSSPVAYVVKGEWHHYAITYRTGRITFYRDGQKISNPATMIALNSPAWTGGLTIGSQTTPVNGMIDEFRVWNQCLSQASIQSYCNQPIERVDSAEKENGLMVYYSFNQYSGNVIDATSNKNNGTRVGFGPDGDAWNSSIGVFTLDFSNDEQSKDITSTCLTNYQRPFRHLSTVINKHQANRFYKLETETALSAWHLVGSIVTDTVTTEVHVDADHNYDLTMETEWSGFANPVRDHRIYQTVTLPAGIYTFSVESLDAFQASGCYLVATVGDTLVGLRHLSETFAKGPLTDKSLTFRLSEEKKISLGIIYNMTGQLCVTIYRFNLLQQPYQQITGDGLTNIYDAVSKGQIHQITPIAGGLRFASERLIPVRIYTIGGQCVFNEDMSGTKYIQLPKGIYVANGEKIAVTK